MAVEVEAEAEAEAQGMMAYLLFSILTMRLFEQQAAAWGVREAVVAQEAVVAKVMV